MTIRVIYPCINCGIHIKLAHKKNDEMLKPTRTEINCECGAKYSAYINNGSKGFNVTVGCKDEL